MGLAGRTKRQRRKQRRRDAAHREFVRRQRDLEMRERLDSPLSPMIDVAFTNLHTELAQWPDGWQVDRHGDEAGNNPHVWFPMAREGHRLRNDLLGFVYPLTTTPIPAGTLRCTCGVLQADYEHAKAELEALIARYNVRDQGMIMLSGIISRDVQ